MTDPMGSVKQMHREIVDELTERVSKAEQALAGGPARSMTYGELWQISQPVAQRIESHVWDNMNVSEQRDWLLKEFKDVVEPPIVMTMATTELREENELLKAVLRRYKDVRDGYGNYSADAHLNT